MAKEDDPLSPANIGAHVLVLMLLMLSGCGLDWARHRYNPPLITNALVGMGEIVIAIYLLGSIGHAIRWSYEQWTGQPSNTSQGRSIRQFLPRRKDVKKALTLDRTLRFIIVSIVILGVLLIVGELTGNTNIPSPDPRLDFINPKVFYDWVRWINQKSLVIAFILAMLSVLSVISFFVTVVFRPRKLYT